MVAMNAIKISVMNELLQARLVCRESSDCQGIWGLLDRIKDPEIPVISLWDLGVLQNVEQLSEASVRVTITPTYSGCPAMHEIEQDIVNLLAAQGFKDVDVVTQLSPAWSTDMMSNEGKKQLREYGIAPPERGSSIVQCPQCCSVKTRKISEFGSTACKALFQCQDCMEPFDYFKCI